MDWMRTLISIVTYLAIMYASAIMDSKSGEMARDREIARIRLKASNIGKEVRAN